MTTREMAFSAVWLGAVIGAGTAAAGQASGDGVVLFVAPDGDDGHSGRMAESSADGRDGPLATPAAALAAARRLRADGEAGPITIHIRGRHFLDAPLVLTPEDSGTAQGPLVITGNGAERPILSGGRRITGWRKGEDGLWTVEIPEASAGEWRFRQLFVDGSRRRPARSPNAGYYRVAELLPGPPIPNSKPVARDRFVFAPGDIRPWRRLDDVRVMLIHSWETSIHPLKSVDTQANVVEFAAPMREWWSIGHWEGDQRYYVENALELLDEPGEWYLDGTTGVLSYHPFPGEDLRKVEAIAPVLTELVRLDGNADEGRFVEHVVLRGLTLHHADWVLSPEGNSSTQAAVTVPAAVTAEGARHCVLEECEIAHVGTYGVSFGRGCRHNRIERNHLHDLGAGGIRLGETKMPERDEVTSMHNRIHNNYIHDSGKVYAAGVGIWLAQAARNEVTHNEIHSFDYTGISVGWTWSDAPSRTLENTIAYNRVHHVMRGVLSDGGGIYTLGTQTGTVIRNNVFHDIWPYMGRPAMAWGIYMDQGSNGLTVEDNLVYHTLTGGIMNTGEHGNRVRNNIFALSAWHAAWRYAWRKEPSSVVERNIFYLTQGELFHDDAGRDDVRTRWDRNLYWRSDGRPPTFYGDSFAEWQAKGRDVNGRVADPRFADLAGGDFSLAEDSPALELGFRPFDPGRAGLVGPDEWRALPRQAVFAPTVLPPPPPPPEPLALADGFEETPVGQPPRQAVVVEERRGDSIRVTDAACAEGRHSLRIVDAPSLQHVFNPHFFYQPHLREGLARTAFDLKWSRPAVIVHEWRDARRPYRTGPSLRVDAEGRLTAGGKHLADLPDGTWVCLEVFCALGDDADGTYRVRLTLPGRAAQEFAALRVGGDGFDRLEWLGFVSLADEATVFHLDDLHIDTSLKPDAPAGRGLPAQHEEDASNDSP